MVRTSVTLGCASCATFLFLPHFDIICDLLLNRRTAAWNLFVNCAINCVYTLFETVKLPGLRAESSFEMEEQLWISSE